MEWESIGLRDPVWYNRGIRINHCSPTIDTSAISSGRTNVTACRKGDKKGIILCFVPFIIFRVCLMLLHMYVISTSH